MKWNGRSYRPASGISLKKKPFDFQEALKPLGEKNVPVWGFVVGVNTEPESSPIPSPTPTPTITPSATPIPVNCKWSGASVDWISNTNDWNDCQNVPVVTPSVTPTYTPSPTPTPQVIAATESWDAANYTSGNWTADTGTTYFNFVNGPTKISDFGGMVRFDGVDDYAFSEQNFVGYNIIPNETSWSLEFWYRWNGGNSAYVPLIVGNSNTSLVSTRFTDGRQIQNAFNRIYLKDATANNFATGVDAQRYVPVQIVYTWDNTTLRAYRNGGLVYSSNTFVYNNRTNTQPYYLGGVGAGPDNASVDYAIIRTYNSVLTAGQISQNYIYFKNRFGL